MVAFQLFLQLEKQRKVRWVGDDSHVAFGKKFPGEKKRMCETVHCRDATTSSLVTEVEGKVFAHF
jgi:hypothetical protein